MMDIFISTLIGFVASVFTNYLADVLPVTRRFSKPACLNCGHAYNIADYLLFKSCRQCGSRRSIRTWATVLTLMPFSLYVWETPPAYLGYPVSIILIVYFATVFIIDLEHRLILHPTSLFGVALGLGVGWLRRGLYDTLLGGLGGFLIMLAIYYFGVLFSRYRARRMEQAGIEPDDEEALGFGDVILSGILGLMLGWPFIGFGLLLGVLLAGVFGLFMMLFMLIVKKYKENALMIFMPYGPFLILSAFSLLFFIKQMVAMRPW